MIGSFSLQKKSRTSTGDDRRRKGRYSSDEDKPSSSSRSSKGDRRVSDKRREQERRREQRLEREKERRRRRSSENREKDKDASSRSKIKDLPSTSNAEKEKAKKKKTTTLDSIYSAIYTDKSDDAKSNSSGEDDEVEDSSARAKSPKSEIKAKRRVKDSEESSAVSSSSSSSSEGEDLEASSRSSASAVDSVSEASSSVASSSSTSSSSSSSSSESSEEEEEEEVKKARPKPKRAAGTTTSKAIIQSSSVEEHSEESKASSTPSSMEIDVEKEDDAEEKKADTLTMPLDKRKDSELALTESDVKEEEATPKKPVPVRQPSLLAGNGDGQSQVAAHTSVQVLESSPHISDHCYARPSSEVVQSRQQLHFQSQFENDHGYTRPRTPPDGDEKSRKDPEDEEKPVVAPTVKPAAPKSKAIAVKQQQQPEQQRRQERNLLQAEKAPQLQMNFPVRDSKQQFDVLYRFLTKGLDLEDIGYLKRSYEMMLNAEENRSNLHWLNDTHWVDHSVTDIADPPRKKRRDDSEQSSHSSGCARTQGFYRLDAKEKARTKYHLHRGDAADIFARTMDGSATKGRLQTAQSLSREARSAQRRQLAVLGEEVSHSDLLKFNQLKVRIEIPAHYPGSLCVACLLHSS